MARIKLDEGRLFELKSEIEEMKMKSSELSGQKNAIIKQLTSDWGCSTIKQAEKKLEDIMRERKEIEGQIKIKTEELGNKYE